MRKTYQFETGARSVPSTEPPIKGTSKKVLNVCVTTFLAFCALALGLLLGTTPPTNQTTRQLPEVGPGEAVVRYEPMPNPQFIDGERVLAYYTIKRGRRTKICTYFVEARSLDQESLRLLNFAESPGTALRWHEEYLRNAAK